MREPRLSIVKQLHEGHMAADWLSQDEMLGFLSWCSRKKEQSLRVQASCLLTNISLDILNTRDFPSGLVAVTLSFQCGGPGFDLWSGN